MIVQGGTTFYFSVFNDDGIDNPLFAIQWSSTSAASNPRWFRQSVDRAWTMSGSNVNTAFRLNGQASVPEPSTIVLLGVGVVGAAVIRPRRKPPR